MGWTALAADAPLDSAQPPAQQPTAVPSPQASQAPTEAPSAAPAGFAPLPADAQLDASPSQAPPAAAPDQTQTVNRPSPTDAPIIVAAIRTTPKAQEIDPSHIVAGFDGEVSPDQKYHSSLSDADKAEYASFFTDPKNPPSAEALRLWFHQKTGAYMGNADDIVKSFAKSGKFSTNQSFVTPTVAQSGPAAFVNHTANSIAKDYGPEVGGAFDALGLGGDGRPSIWNSDTSLGNTFANDADLERAQLERDSADHPIWSGAGELAGAALSAPVDAAALNAVGLAHLPGVLKAAGEGAAYGSGSAGPGNRIVGATSGAALGAATDLAIPAVKSLVSGSTAGNLANREFATAANRQGIDYMAADLPNSLKSKFGTALAGVSLGAIPLAKQGERNIASAATAADRVAGDIGTVTDSTGAGQAAQRGARQFMATTQGKMGQLYDAIPIPDNAPANVANTRSALTNIAQSFQSNPKLAAAFRDSKISAYLDALTPQTSTESTGILDASGNPITRDTTHGGGLSWSDIKDFRTRVGQIIGQPGLTSDGQQMADLRTLYGSLSDDMKATAQGYGSQAENAFNRANTYARARADRIENVASLILGPNDDKGPQSAFEALQRLGNEKGGDPLKLARAMRTLPDDEANSVRATILDGLGDANPGQQDDKGAVFSPATWLTNWNKLSDRAKNVLFTGEHRAALNDLALLFSGMKQSSKFANSSKTGISVVGLGTLSAIWSHPIVGSLAAALQYGGGKLLASPSFARRVAGTPMNAKAAVSYWNRPWVKGLINQNPAIAGEIQAFQSAFLGHVANDNGVHTGLAATPGQSPQDQQPNSTQP